jgi:glycosyltransferase involved in cell wall biosynthesis
VCLLVSDVLTSQGWQVDIVGPSRWPTRWQFRLGLNYPLMSRSATSAARLLEPDLIVSNGYLGVGGFRGAPRVHLYHGTTAGAMKATAHFQPRKELLRRTVSAGAAEAIAARGAAKVVCVSRATADEVHRYYRASTDAVIANAVDTSVFAPRPQKDARARLGLAESARYALFVGRLEHGKGGNVTVEAARRAGYELLVAGAKGAPGIQHLGVLSPEELPDAYAASDCVVLPSLYEACSLVVLEALACERPLLTTRVGWMTSFLKAIPDYDALCVESSVEDLTARLLCLSDLDTKRLTSMAREYVLKHNSLECYSDSWRELLEDVEL